MTTANSIKSFIARFPRATILIGCTIALSASAGSLWVAESRGTLKLDALDGAVVLEIPESPYGTGAVGVDPTNGNVWTWGEQRLRGFDRDGVNFLDIESTSYPIWEHPNDLVVDGNAGNIWVNLGSNLYRLNLSGQVVGSLLNYGATCNSMTLDRERSRLWLCSYDSVRAYDAAFQEVVSLALLSGDVACQSAWDEFRDELWVAVNDKLRRYNSTGVMTFEMQNPAGPTNTYFLKPDGKGGVWLGSETQFLYIDPTGAVGSWITPFHDFSYLFIRDAVVHPVDASIWIGNETHIRRFSTAGTQLHDRFLDLGDGNDRYLQNMDLFEDQSKPIIEFSQPANNIATNQTRPTLRLVFFDSGSGIDDDTLELTINEAPLAASCTIDALGAECVPNAALPDGLKTVTARISDSSGNESDAATVRFTVDTVAPQITVSSPVNGAATNQPSIIILGSLSEPATLRINGTLVGLDGTNNFSFTAALQEGQNSLAIVATDNATNATTLNRLVTLDTQAPNVPDVGFIGVSNPSAGVVTITGQGGSVEADALVQVTNLRTGQSVTVAATAAGAFVAQIAGEEADQLQIRAIDAAQNSSNPAQTAVPGNLPPNPATVATPLSTTAVTPFAESIAFLYSGSNPIQTGVAAGAIQPEFAAVVRGSATTRAGQPLANVLVSIKDHPEYGQTRTRADGRFDLVVNGGGVLTLDYQRNGYLSLHRYVDTPQQDYVRADNVVMIQVDTAVTEIALNTTTLQAHQSSVMTDLSGSRRASLMVPPGTTATMTLPDGSIQALTTSMRVRATEYTVGVSGMEAMPAPLPPTSAYTYAVELSVDEAIAAGARSVNFNQPLPVFVENFLNFPVGGDVPVGFYDRAAAAWIPSENGRVIRIIAITGGLANLDVDGSNQAAGSQELTALGITNAERQRLATLYPVGASFWRVRVTHFSPCDINWPWGDVPEDADAPPDFPVPPDDPDDDETPECSGCTIEAHTQTLGESIALTGTQHSLHYRSDRARSLNRIEFPVTGNTIPPSLGVVMVSVSVAGRDIYNEILGGEYSPVRALPTPNQIVSLQWDGRDAYGRRVIGKTQALVQVSYGYTPSYTTPTGLLAFGLASRTGAGVTPFRPGGGGNTAIPRFVYVVRNKLLTVRAPSPAMAQVGAWTFDVHHTLDVAGKDGIVLYQGNGSRRNLHLQSPTIQDWISPTSDPVEGIALDFFGGSPLMARSSGRLSFGPIIFAGGGSTPPADGLLATEAAFPPIMDATAHSNDQYFVTGNQVWRRRFNGILSRIAGTGASGSSGDDGAARDATLNGPAGIVLAPDGTIFVAETLGHRIRRIGPDGRISTHAGTGIAGFAGDAGIAANAQFRNPRGLALAKDGSLIVADEGNRRIRRIEPNGRITTIAGNGAACVDPESLCGDGALATNAFLTAPRDVAVYPNGDIGIADAGTFRVRVVQSNGSIVTVAGTGRGWTAAPQGNGGPAALSELSNDITVAVNSRGETIIADRDRVRRVTRPGPGQDAAGYSLSSEDGATLFRFDPSGRHLGSLDALTGVELQRFGYDSAGRLTSITDRSGNSTTIERNASGVPSAVVSPDGQRTVLTLNASGFLESVQDPAGNTIRMQYSSNGLLTRYTDARDNVSTYEFDARGRLTRDLSPGESGWQITRTQNQSGAVVSMTSAEGWTSQFTSSETALGQRTLASRPPDGVASTLTVAANGAEELTSPDGSRASVSYGPDPRFGMQAPVPTSNSIRLPSGLTRSSSAARTATLSNSADPLSVVEATEISTLNGRESRTVYRAAGREVTTTSPEGRTTRSTLDSLGRVVETSTPGIEPIRMSYDARGRLVSIESGAGNDLRRTTIGYFSSGPVAGFVSTFTDPENRVTEFGYDPAGRLTRQLLPGSREVLLGYDANGNLTSITPPGRGAHAFEYSTLNLAATYAPPAAGMPTSATTHAYNRDRQLISSSHPDGRQLTFGYNAAGKLETATGVRGVTQFFYDPTTGQFTGSLTPEGQRLTFVFDGSLLASSTSSDVISGNVTLTRNTDFDVSAVAVNGASVSVGYDGDGLLTSVGALAVGRRADNGLEQATTLINVSTTSTYNQFGELARYDVSRPTASEADIINQIRSELTALGVDLDIVWDLVNTSTARTQYNNLVSAAQLLPLDRTGFNLAHSEFRSRYTSLRNAALNQNICECSDEVFAQIVAAIGRTDASVARLLALVDSLNSGSGGLDVVFSTQFLRDRLGRITRKTEQAQGTEVEYDYAYDAAGRLAEVQTDGVVSASYTYDANGNRLTSSGAVATYDEQDRLLTSGPTAFTYSASGELLTRTQAGQTTSYGYDEFGNLMSVQLPDGRAISYVIDGQNRRVGKRINGTLTQGLLYQDDLQIVAELDGAGAVLSRFVYGTKPNVPDYMVRAGATYRIVSDHLGSVRLVIDASSGQVAQRLDYDAYGIVTLDTNPAFQPFGFGGGLYDRDTALVRFGARDYDPSVGRWTAKDPILFSGNDTNLYAYTSGNPVGFVDPFGLRNFAPSIGSSPIRPQQQMGRSGSHISPYGPRGYHRVPIGSYNNPNSPIRTPSNRAFERALREKLRTEFLRREIRRILSELPDVRVEDSPLKQIHDLLRKYPPDSDLPDPWVPQDHSCRRGDRGWSMYPG